MKKPHVLNRPMFNKGGTSAYGRGIASNLVTDEQRQRFNYGGRVGLAQGTGGFFNFAPSNVENIQRLPTGEIDYNFYEKEDLKVPTTWGEKILPPLGTTLKWMTGNQALPVSVQTDIISQRHIFSTIYYCFW